MKPLLVVDDFEKVFDVGEGVREVRVVVDVDFLDFEGFHERFGHRVVVRIRLTAHADLDMVLVQQRDVFVASVLYPLVRVMHQFCGDVPTRQRHLEGFQSQGCVDVTGECPPDDFAAEGIQNHRQVHEVLQESNVGDIGSPELIRTHRNDVLCEVGEDMVSVFRVRRGHESSLPAALQMGLVHQA